MTTLADLTLVVRRSLGDALRMVIDTVDSYDGNTNPLSLGKDLPVEVNSDSVAVNSALKQRGIDYTIDYEARQLYWVNLPAAGSALRVAYKESRYKSEQITEGINQGRRILFPTIYKKGVASITTQNLVRQYDLATAANEGWARTVFKEGHMSYKILRAFYLPQGAVAQTTIPYRRFWQEGESTVHLWELLPVGYTLYFELAYAFTPLVNAADVTDIPDVAQSLVTEWAVAALALKQEPVRGRMDTVNVAQGQYANPPGTMAQTSEDFARRVREMRGLLNVEPLTVELRDMPYRWQIGT